MRDWRSLRHARLALSVTKCAQVLVVLFEWDILSMAEDRTFSVACVQSDVGMEVIRKEEFGVTLEVSGTRTGKSASSREFAMAINTHVVAAGEVLNYGN
jgi:hypothetical protein